MSRRTILGSHLVRALQVFTNHNTLTSLLIGEIGKQLGQQWREMTAQEKAVSARQTLTREVTNIAHLFLEAL